VYYPFLNAIEEAGRVPVQVPVLKGADRWELDLDRLEAAFAAGNKLFLLCNPHNPVGRAYTRDELAAVAELTIRHDVRVVSDEIHAPLSGRPGVDDVPRFTSVLQVPGGERALALVSPSKAWNLAGLRAALLVAGRDAVADLARVPEHALDGVNHVGVIAQTAALETGREWLDEVLTALDANRALAAGLLAERLPQVRYHRDHATYLAWLDCRDLGLGDDPARVFLDHGRVAVNPGLTFGAGGAGHVRLNLATSRAILTEAVERMASVVRGPGNAGVA
jgi:cystathionine beta-lyase